MSAKDAPHDGQDTVKTLRTIIWYKRACIGQTTQQPSVAVQPLKKDVKKKCRYRTSSELENSVLEINHVTNVIEVLNETTASDRVSRYMHGVHVLYALGSLLCLHTTTYTRPHARIYTYTLCDRNIFCVVSIIKFLREHKSLRTHTHVHANSNMPCEARAWGKKKPEKMTERATRRKTIQCTGGETYGEREREKEKREQASRESV